MNHTRLGHEKRVSVFYKAGINQLKNLISIRQNETDVLKAVASNKVRRLATNGATRTNGHLGDDMGHITFRVLKHIRCVHFEGEGDVSFDFLMKQIKAVHQHPDFDLSFNTFVDFENAVVSFKEDGLDEYKTFFKELQKSGVRRKWAVYSKRDATLKSANMSLLLQSDEIEVDVFNIRDQALAFLGITDTLLAEESYDGG